MTVEEINEEKSKAQTEIIRVITDFENKTGFYVEKIKLIKMEPTTATGTAHNISTRFKISLK